MSLPSAGQASTWVYQIWIFRQMGNGSTQIAASRLSSEDKLHVGVV